MLLGDILRHNASKYAHELALHSGEADLTWAQLNERTNRLCSALATCGLQAGDRLSFLGANTHRYVEAYFAAAKLGATLAPLDYRATPTELRRTLTTAEPRLIVVDAQFANLISSANNDVPSLQGVVGIGPGHNLGYDYETILAEANPIEPDISVDEESIPVLFFTSGTASQPKAVMLSHRNLVQAALIHVADRGLTQRDCWLTAQPLCFSGPLGMILPALLCGSRTVVMDFDAEGVLKAIERYRVTSTVMVPTMVNMLLSHKEFTDFDLSSLRSFYYAAAPMSVALNERATNAFGVQMSSIYGLTESSAVGTILRAEDLASLSKEQRTRRLASIGRPTLTTDVGVFDGERRLRPGEDHIGEIRLRGSTIMQGYWKNPEATNDALKGGWLSTGDLGRIDADGFIYLVDRQKDVIISGGANVYSSDVEDVVCRHPAVAEVAVIGVPDEKWGEAVKAVVVLREAASVTEAELLKFCRNELAGFRCPRSVDFVTSLPRNTRGKLLKRALREQYWAERETRII